ncbi:MAG TPA: DUF4942 domain-containing protein, partial [Gallicola sp.]|nr:DUF4942 domain-containing protein [Gallicola sp.]
PFSNGDDHLLKALDMQKDGGSIVCLLNAETIKNPYSNSRKVLVQKLNDLDAKIEYIENAFINAENKTGVEVALIKIFIPETEKPSYIFEELMNEEKYNEETQVSEYQLIKDDLVEEIVRQYQIEVKAGIRLINEYQAMRPHILRDFDEKSCYNKPILELKLNDCERSLTINNYVCKTRYKYWQALFNNPKFTEKLTSNLIREYSNRIEELQNYDFSVYNIYQIKIEMSKNIIKGVEDTIIKLFDELSYQNHWHDETSKNIHYFNGWKTNKAWYINKRVIIPYMNAFNDWNGSFEPGYKVLNKLRDIEKILNYLDGNRTLDVDLEEVLKLAQADNRTTKIPLKYFNITFYKKGTCHIEFTNLELLKKFNIYGCQNKGWLPPSYGKKTYNEMDIAEQEVVNEFEGKESYNDTFINKNYYITKTEDLLLIGVD